MVGRRKGALQKACGWVWVWCGAGGEVPGSRWETGRLCPSRFGVYFGVFLAFGSCVFNTSYFLNRHCVCRLALGDGDP
jgi:hypothetical protein